MWEQGAGTRVRRDMQCDVKHHLFYNTTELSTVRWYLRLISATFPSTCNVRSYNFFLVAPVLCVPGVQRKIRGVLSGFSRSNAGTEIAHVNLGHQTMVR